MLADEHARGAGHASVETVAAHHLLHDDVVVLGIVDRLRADRLADRGVEGQAQHGDPLEPFLLQRLQQLGAHEDQTLDQGIARVGLLGGLERPVEVVEDVDELEQQPLVALLNWRSTSRVTRSRNPSFSVLTLR